MREVKFRGMYTGDLELPAMMVYGSLINNGDERPVIVGFNGMQQWLVDPETVGQFTGLHDAAGNEIYEGDIFTSTQYPFSDEGNSNYAGIIDFDDRPEYCGWFYGVARISTRVRGAAGGGGLADLNPDDLTIIGNIHENPELLEVQDD